MSEKTPRNYLDPYREGGEPFNSANIAAQNLRFFPSLSKTVTHKFHTSISLDPENEWAARLTRDMVLGTMSHVVYSRLISELLPRIKKGHSLVPPTGLALDEEVFMRDGAFTKVFNFQTLTPLQQQYFIAGMSWLTGAAELVFQEIEANPNHLYRPLVEQFSKTYATYRDKKIRRDERIHTMKPDYQPKFTFPENVKDELIDGMADNLDTSRTLLERRQRAREQRTPGISPEDLGRVVRPDLLRIDDVASTSLTSGRAILASAESMVEKGPLDDPVCVFTHTDIMDGPMKQRHACAGQFILRSPLRQERREADEFFQLSGITIVDGAFDIISALLVFSERLSEETTWKESVTVSF